MKTLVIYDSQFGNTKRLAEAIAHDLEAQGAVQTIRAAEANADLFDAVDLLVIGGPTIAHGLSPEILRLLEDAREHAHRDHHPRVLAFDTRMKWPKWLSGSAADKIARHLAALGYVLLAPPASFLVEDSHGPLVAGEQARAVAWAHTALAQLVPAAA